MTLQMIVLGMLAISPMTGYDVHKAFDATVGQFWSADRAQLYRTLKAIEDAGLARVEVVPGGSYPDRREHHITDLGVAALTTWLRQPTVDVSREPFLARVFFAGNLAAPEVRTILQERRLDAVAMLTRLTSQAEQYGDLPAAPLPQLMRVSTLLHGIAHARAELAWLDEIEPLVSAR